MRGRYDCLFSMLPPAPGLFKPLFFTMCVRQRARGCSAPLPTLTHPSRAATQGFLRTKVVGMTVDVSPFVPLEPEDHAETEVPASARARPQQGTTTTTAAWSSDSR